MNDQHAFESVPASAPKQARYDVLGAIHKAIRFAMCDTLSRAGQTSYEDEAEARAFCQLLDDVIAFCEMHADLEDRFVRPVLAGRVQGALDVIDGGHARLRRLTAEIEHLRRSLLEAPADARARIGRLLYDHVGAFVAENLAHMAEEEHVVQPLLQRLYTDAELIALNERIVATLSDDKRRRSAVWYLRSSNARERQGLVGGLLAQAPGAAVAALLRAAAPSLPGEELSALLARCTGSDA